MIRKVLFLLFFSVFQVCFAQIDKVTSVEILKDGVKIYSNSDQIILKFCRENILLINFKPQGQEDQNLISESPVGFSGDIIIDQTSDSIELSSKLLSVIISKNPFGFSVAHNKKIIITSDNNAFQTEKTKLKIAGKNFYGISNRNIGNLTVNKGDKIYAGEQGHAGAPFFWTTVGYGMLFDEDGGEITIKNQEMEFLKVKNKKKNSLLYIFQGEPKEIISSLTEVTGKPPLFPKWSLGFLNSEWGIDQKELLEHINNYRAKNIPIDGFILDFDWMDWGNDNYGEFRFGPKFPDAQSGKLKKILDSNGIKLSGIKKPRVHLETEQGKYADDNKFFVGYQTDYFSKKKVGLLDFYKPETGKWYWDSFVKKGNCFKNGLVGYWNDEADAYGGNFMFTYMQKSQYEGQRAYNNIRVFSLNRNFYCGNQKYAYGLWSGDIDSGFSIMAQQRLIMLSSVNLGVSWWSMDIGGFKNNPSSESYSRWIQFGAFVPIFRVHGSFDHQRQPWFYDKESERIAVKYIRLRYELIPYIYSYAWESHNSGLSICRPLVINYPNDPRTANLYSEYLFGNEMLVSPIVTANKNDKLSVYLPEGEWYDYWTDKKYKGSQSLKFMADEEDISLFIKAGSIIPTQEVGRFVDDPKISSELILNIYPGPESSFTLYDDDGITYDYEKSVNALTEFNSKSGPNLRELSVSKTKGVYKPGYNKILVKFHDLDTKPGKITLDGKIINEVKSEKFKNKTGWKYDNQNKICFVIIPFDNEAKRVLLTF